MPAFVGGIGGAERVVSTLLRHFDHARFECHLAMVLAGAQLEELPSQVAVHHLLVTRMRYALPSIIRLVWKIRPHTILSTVSYLNVMLLLARSFLPRGTRLLIREATTPSSFARNAGHPHLWNWFYRRLYPHADKIICLSDSMQRDLVDQFHVPLAKLVRIYNPIDLAMVRRLAGATESPYRGLGPHIVAMGRLQNEKAYDVLLTAFTLVRRAIPGARLNILGEGPLEAQLKQQAAGLGVADAVAFRGFQANPWPYVRHADLFVLASRYEGLPNSLLEALALGVSVVATDCPGGTREIQRSATQIALVPPESPEALAEAIIAALNCAQKKSSAAKQNDESLRRFDIQTIVEEYSRLL